MSIEADRRIDKDNYRDHLSTVSEKGKRNWIYPRKPSGRYHNYRQYFSWVLLVFFFVGPFLKINGQPILLVNILERKFIIFGMAFWPQDLHILVFGMLAFVIFVVLFTAIFGRLFCGWACPQTVFMEMVFRKIEYLIDGDAVDQMRLAKAPWTPKKVFKRVSKHSIFYGLSFLIGNLFLAYVIGIEQLWDMVTDPPREHIGGLSAMLVFSTLFYGVFAFMREQVCHFVCPYGRMQSVMLDNNSINVMYDYNRGESRAKVGDRKKVEAGKATLADLGFSEEADFGDCIDCYQCVKICPMGIDIRNGTQLECVHCTACIDACDTIMDKIDKPRGLIRYTSENAIRGENKKFFTPRTIGYLGVLLVLLSTFITLLVTRPVLETTVFRQPGTLYQELPNNEFSNIYQLRVINKTFEGKDFDIQLLSPAGVMVSLGDVTQVEAQESAEGRFMVQLPQSSLTGYETELSFGVFIDGEQIETIKTGFLSPRN